jgi:hypothetical protein
MVLDVLSKLYFSEAVVGRAAMAAFLQITSVSMDRRVVQDYCLRLIKLGIDKILADELEMGPVKVRAQRKRTRQEMEMAMANSRFKTLALDITAKLTTQDQA